MKLIGRNKFLYSTTTTERKLQLFANVKKNQNTHTLVRSHFSQHIQYDSPLRWINNANIQVNKPSHPTLSVMASNNLWNVHRRTQLHLRTLGNKVSAKWQEEITHFRSHMKDEELWSDKTSKYSMGKKRKVDNFTLAVAQNKLVF